MTRPGARVMLVECACGDRSGCAAASWLEWPAAVRPGDSESLSPEIVAPVPLAELGVYRLDLRDYF